MEFAEIKARIDKLAESGRSRTQIAVIVQEWPISPEIIEDVRRYIHQVHYTVTTHRRKLVADL